MASIKSAETCGVGGVAIDIFGAVLEFSHSPNGAIESIAGQEFGTLAFDPNYDAASHSLAGFRSAMSSKPVTVDVFYFDDGTCASSVDSRELLCVLDIVRGLRYILQHHDYPDFLQWRTGC